MKPVISGLMKVFLRRWIKSQTRKFRKYLVSHIDTKAERDAISKEFQSLTAEKAGEIADEVLLKLYRKLKK